MSIILFMEWNVMTSWGVNCWSDEDKIILYPRMIVNEELRRTRKDWLLNECVDWGKGCKPANPVNPRLGWWTGLNVESKLIFRDPPAVKLMIMNSAALRFDLIYQSKNVSLRLFSLTKESVKIMFRTVLYSLINIWFSTVHSPYYVITDDGPFCY